MQILRFGRPGGPSSGLGYATLPLVGLLLALGSCAKDDGSPVEEAVSGPRLAAGICRDPVEPVGLDGDGVRHVGTVDDHASGLEGSCGNSGREVVHRLVAPTRGTMVVGLEAERNFVFYARRDCADARDELFCGGPQDGSRSIAMEKGERLYVVVDAPVSVSEPTYRLVVDFVPTLSEGQACDLDGAKGNCDEGLYCEWSALVCARNTAPVLETADALFRFGGGSDARVRVWGGDPDGNLAGLILRFFDQSGALVQVNGLDELYTAFDETARQATEFSWTRVLNRLASRYPAAVAVEAELVDGSQARSNTISLPIVRPDPVATGESCDPEGWAGFCGEGDLCQQWRAEPPFCERQEAPVLSSVRAWRSAGVSLTVVVDGSDPNGDVAEWYGSLLKEDRSSILAFRGETHGKRPFDRSLMGEMEVHAISTWDGILDRYPEATAVWISIVDTNNTRSQFLEVPIETPVEVGAGEACDPDVVATLCGEGLACGGEQDEGLGCIDRAEARRQKCAAAPTLRAGGEVTGALGRDDLWTPYPECSPASSGIVRHEGVDAVVRLEVEEPTTTLRLTTDLPGTQPIHTLLYALTDCESDEFVACNDEWANGVAHTTLTMKNVLPGTYWVVVDSAAGAGAFALRATAE